MGRRPRASGIAGSEAEEDDEEIYDWSNEEDLVDQEAKYQKNMGKIPKKQGFSIGNPSPDSSGPYFSTQRIHHHLRGSCNRSYPAPDHKVKQGQ
ncbi:hypothetical protein FRC03_006876 [Tulasnella sp. 419]|nr:hypothetical protein FRC03_006876 [Tulasnella sp. 419]